MCCCTPRQCCHDVVKHLWRYVQQAACEVVCRHGQQHGVVAALQLNLLTDVLKRDCDLRLLLLLLGLLLWR